MRSTKRSRPKVSACLIVKDEETKLRDCLDSVRDVVDEIVVVDTGSTDGTLDIARQFDARIYTYPWNDDFAAARNAGLKHARGDWIFHIDADERLDSASIPEFKKWTARRGRMCVSVLIDSPAAGHRKGHLSRAHRLFRNLPGLRFSGRIHEQISPSFQALGGTEAASAILLRHSGYAGDEKQMAAKSARNRRLLAKQLEEEPNNAYCRFTLAQNLILAQEYEAAKTHLQQALALGNLPQDIVCSIMNNLAEIHMKQGRLSEAVAAASEALKISPGQTTAHLLLYQVYEGLNDAPAQIAALEAVLEIDETRQKNAADVSVEAYVDRTAILLNLGRLYAAQHCFDKALDAFSGVVAGDPHCVPALRGLAECHMATGKLAEAEDALERLRALQPNDPRTLETLALLAIRRKDFPSAIAFYGQLLKMEPSNGDLMKRMAALYKLTGDLSQARAWLLRAGKAA